ncbi:MAG: class I SAM-dependent methyltransferase [Promethearchaeota archaeon]
MGFEHIKKVSDVYDAIASDFSRSRGKKPWGPLVEFITGLKEDGAFHGIEGSILLDVGSGNGRNAAFFSEELGSASYIGLDLSLPLLFRAIENQGTGPSFNYMNASMTALPFRRDSIGIMISVAALHHAPSRASLRDSIKEIKGVMRKSNSTFILSVWRKWQGRFRKQVLKNTFKKLLRGRWKEEPGLVMVPWTDSRTGDVKQRYYLLLSKRELKRGVSGEFKIKKWELLGGPGKKDNHFLLLNPRD